MGGLAPEFYLTIWGLIAPFSGNLMPAFLDLDSSCVEKKTVPVQRRQDMVGAARLGFRVDRFASYLRAKPLKGEPPTTLCRGASLVFS